MNWTSIVSAILVATTATAQTVYQLPFASRGNTIELIVANTSAVGAADVRVSLHDAPAWLRFAQKEQTINSLAAGEEQCAVFVFGVDKSAPVGQEHRLQFRIRTGDGQSWLKEIPIIVAAPETLELFQNYPNPFNPTTAIGYQLPNPSHVALRVFNLLGQEVARLVEQERPPGYHQETFDAHNVASGIYVYQLVATATDGTRTVARRAMVLVK